MEGDGGVDGAVAVELPHLIGGEGAEGGHALDQVGADRHLIEVHRRRRVQADPMKHGAEADGAGRVAVSGPGDGDDARRVLDRREAHVFQFQERAAAVGAVFDERASPDPRRWRGRAPRGQWGRTRRTSCNGRRGR